MEFFKKLKDHLLTTKDLKVHIFGTYFTLRMGIVVMAFALPLALWIGGYFRAGLHLQSSMSAYYLSGNGAMRDVFVGILFSVGFSLYLYKGYTPLENYVLNLAGIFLGLVALFPTGDGITKHDVFAVLFFMSIAYVCFFRARDTLNLIAEKEKDSSKFKTIYNHYKNAYKMIGIGLVASPAIAIMLSYLLKPNSPWKCFVFYFEAVGVYIFAVYWIVKSIEIKNYGAEKYAIEGKLTIGEPLIKEAKHFLKPIPMLLKK